MTDGDWYLVYLAAFALLVVLAVYAVLGLGIDGLAARSQRRPTRYPTAAGVAERTSLVTAWLWLPISAYVSAGVLGIGLDLLVTDARRTGSLGAFMDAAGEMPTPFGAPLRGIWVLVGGVLLIEAGAIVVARREGRGRSRPWRLVENWGVLRETLRRADDVEVTSRAWRTDALVTRRHLRTSGGRAVRLQRRALVLLRTVAVGHHHETRMSVAGLTWSRVPWSAVARWSARRPASLASASTSLLLAAVATYAAGEVVEYDAGVLRLLGAALALTAFLATYASWLRLDLLVQARAGARRQALERDVDLLLASTAQRARARPAQEGVVLLRLGRFTVRRG